MDLIQQLTRDEGEILHAYQDSLGFWTLGVGVLIDARKGGGITKSESAYLLGNRIADRTTELAQALPWTDALDPIRKAALLNMAYNLGIDGLLEFHHMLAAIQAGKYDDAAKEMLASKWALQVGVRATRLAAQMRTGTWQ